MSRLTQQLGLTRVEADEHYQKALIAYEKRQFDEAIKQLTIAIQALPKHPEYYAARGLIYLEDGVEDRARTDFEHALKLFPYEMLAHYGLGMIAYRAKAWDEAQQHFTQAYYANPKRGETVYYLGMVHHRKGEHAVAAQVMKKAQELFEVSNDRRKGDAAKWIKTLEKLATPPLPDKT
ncbi:MAG: tetratricopeptide repeat protein [Anaerolineae bacterium]|nr:tetratricopeptide repeat protein [Anaerolineae bacterium]